MTYNELATKKTESMEVNCIIDDVVNNARWGYTKKAFKTALIVEYDVMTILAACVRYKVTTPFGW